MPAVRILDASTVVLVRVRDGQRELFWVRRSREVSLGGGFYAFPGGRVDDADRQFGATLGDPSGLRVAAVRELFEETGVLLTSAALPAHTLSTARKALLEQRGGSLATCLEQLGNPVIGWGALGEAGRWITPPFMPVRFDARFFVAEVPAGQHPKVWPGELADGEWITPEEALRRWEAGRALLHPPALHLIRCLRDAPFPECQPRMLAPPDLVDFVAQRIEFQRGVIVCPVRTPTIPPATHTNCFLIGDEELVVIDPASADEQEQARLARLCDTLLAEGVRFREILLTHHHHDHVGGVAALRQKLRIPVRAHARTAELLQRELSLDGTVADGESIELGRLRLRPVFTPGHTPGHLCFFEETTGALFAGDMIAGIGSIVVNPPEGDMIQYMASLSRLKGLPVSALYPAHGPTAPDGPRKIDEYILHRNEREAQIVTALKAAGPSSPEELVPAVYTDVVPAMHPLAARSLLAVLDKLVHEGRARVREQRYEML